MKPTHFFILKPSVGIKPTGKALPNDSHSLFPFLSKSPLFVFVLPVLCFSSPRRENLERGERKVGSAEPMAFISFVGRLLFVSVFILSAWQEFNEYGVDGGPAAKALRPKFNVFSKHVLTHTGVQLPAVEMKHLIAASIALKGAGSLLFILGSTFGAYLLLVHQLLATPILYDFYNHDADKKEFAQLFVKFSQHLALFGALLFFIGMKNSFPRRQVKKKAPKTKTV